MFKEMLENSGHTVSIYRDGLDILTALHMEEPTTLISLFDILLVDLILPGDKETFRFILPGQRREREA